MSANEMSADQRADPSRPLAVASYRAAYPLRRIVGQSCARSKLWRPQRTETEDQPERRWCVLLATRRTATTPYGLDIVETARVHTAVALVAIDRLLLVLLAAVETETVETETVMIEIVKTGRRGRDKSFASHSVSVNCSS